MKIVFDSSTLILLAKAELLEALCRDIQIVIPQKVRKECTIRDVFDARMIASYIEKNRIRVIEADKKLSLTLKRDFKIHSGEAEALALSVRKELPLAVDDLLTIKACKILGIQFTTAIHFLIELSQKGRIDLEMAMVKLEKLSRFGRYNKRIISDAEKRLKGGR